VRERGREERERGEGEMEMKEQGQCKSEGMNEETKANDSGKMKNEK